jgi:HSP20 family protein
MTLLRKIDPFDALGNDFNDLMKDVLNVRAKLPTHDFVSKGSYPKVDIVLKDDELIIDAAVPGLSREDVNLEVADNILTISAKSNQVEEYKDRYYTKEIKRSYFSRSFKLNDNLDVTKISATLVNGILTISIPHLKPDSFEKQKIKVDIK